MFQVEITLYCVHRYFFVRDSETFRDMFTLPLEDREIPEGNCEDNPIHLHGESSEDFEAFLSVLYPV